MFELVFTSYNNRLSILACGSNHQIMRNPLTSSLPVPLGASVPSELGNSSPYWLEYNFTRRRSPPGRRSVRIYLLGVCGRFWSNIDFAAPLGAAGKVGVHLPPIARGREIPRGRCLLAEFA